MLARDGLLNNAAINTNSKLYVGGAFSPREVMEPAPVWVLVLNLRRRLSQSICVGRALFSIGVGKLCGVEAEVAPVFIRTALGVNPRPALRLEEPVPDVLHVGGNPEHSLVSIEVDLDRETLRVIVWINMRYRYPCLRIRDDKDVFVCRPGGLCRRRAQRCSVRLDEVHRRCRVTRGVAQRYGYLYFGVVRCEVGARRHRNIRLEVAGDEVLGV